VTAGRRELPDDVTSGAGEGDADDWRAYLAANRRGSAARGSVYDPVAGICCHFCRQVLVAASLRHSAGGLMAAWDRLKLLVLADDLVAAGCFQLMMPSCLAAFAAPRDEYSDKWR
jgi:hypothetical protein